MNTASRQYIYPWQSNAWEILQQNLSSGRLPHALLMQGAEGCGVEDFSRIFANLLLCQKPQEGLACGSCQSCELFRAGTHPDFVELQPEVNKEGKVSKIIKVEQVRSLVNFVSQTSMNGGRRVIIINPADIMNQNAANALLKCLEEPGEDTQFLLLSFQASRVMATIRSRCQKVDLPLPDFSVADEWLKTFVDDASERKKLLTMSSGSPLLARDWFEEGAGNEIEIMQQSLSAVLSGEVSPVAVANQWFKEGSGYLLQWWWRWLMVEIKKTVVTEKSLLSHYQLSEKHILQFMTKLQTCKTQLESTANPNEQLLLESLLIDWQALTAVRASAR